MTKRKNGKSKADRLAELRAKLEKQNLGMGGQFLRLEEGRNQVRILPEVGEMDWFFQAVGTHRFPDGATVYCPSFTSEGELECPVCEFVQELYDAGDRASKALAGDMRVRRKFWMNVIDRSNENAGPKILTAGVTIFSPIKQVIGDPDYGNITDPETGTDIKIIREGTGLNTEYEVIASRYESVLTEDKDLMEQWLKDAKDLSYVEVSDDPDEDNELSKGHAVYVKPYDRIVREFDLEGLLEEDEPPQRKSRKKKVTAKQAEEELFDEDDEESGAQKDVRRRSARRRRR